MRLSALVVLFAVLLTSLAARAANKIVVVLPLDSTHAGKKLDANAKVALEEMLRDVAVDNLSAGWTVLTGETTLQVLKDNGVDATNCGDQSCHLSMAREIKADRFISGSVQFSDGEFTASIRLIDTASGRIAASTRVEGTTPKVLRKSFEAVAAKFFQKAGLTEAPPEPKPEPKPEPVPAPAPAREEQGDAKPVPGKAGGKFKQGQVWEGAYICMNMPTAMQLLITEISGDNVKATFNFQNAQVGTIGSYVLNGQLNKKSGQITMKPGDWLVHPPGFDAIGLTGSVNANGDQFEGKMAHPACSTFSVSLDSGDDEGDVSDY